MLALGFNADGKGKLLKPKLSAEVRRQQTWFDLRRKSTQRILQIQQDEHRWRLPLAAWGTARPDVYGQVRDQQGVVNRGLWSS